MAAGTRATKNFVKEALLDDEVLSALKAIIHEAIDSKFQEVIERLDKQDGIILELQCKVDGIEKDYNSLKKRQQACEEKNKRLERQLNDQEQYSRRNSIRLFGIPEKDKENTNEVVCEVARNHLGVNLRPDDIDRTHRVHRRVDQQQHGSAKKPRAIIVKLTSYQTRQRLLLNRRKLKENKTGISLFEDLTTANRTLLWEAFKVSKNPDSKIQAAWSSDGRIIVSVQTAKGTIKRQIHSKEDLASIG